MCKEQKKYDFYKDFYDEHRVSILQYNNLRKHFNKMINDILGPDYYNIEMDVYQSDIACCEDTIRYSQISCLDKFKSFIGL